MASAVDIQSDAADLLAGIWRDGRGEWGCDWPLDALAGASPTGQARERLLPLIQQALMHLALVGDSYRPELLEEDARAFAEDLVPSGIDELAMWLSDDPVGRAWWVDEACAARDLAPGEPLSARLRAGYVAEAEWVCARVGRLLLSSR